MDTKPNNYRPTKAIIDLDALAFNFKSMKAFVGSNPKCMAVVKANAYGHGAVQCAQVLQNEGVDWFGVATIEEGVELRENGISKPIQCFGRIWPGQESLVVENGLTPTIFDLDSARSFDHFAKSNGVSIDVHIKIDTGMGRAGFLWSEAENLVELLKNLSSINIEGLMTHFFSAEAPEHDELTQSQIERFAQVRRTFKENGIEPEIIDIANSPGSIRFQNSHGNLVRFGGGLYGLLDDILRPETKKPTLKPVLSLVSQIAGIKELPAGCGIGYGHTFVTPRNTKLALVPIGYADGYRRGLSNKAYVLVNGQKAPVVGTISMDWTIIDVTDVTGNLSDVRVVLIGRDGNNEIRAIDLAATLGTIGYEITCGLTSRIPKVYASTANVPDEIDLDRPEYV